MQQLTVQQMQQLHPAPLAAFTTQVVEQGLDIVPPHVGFAQMGNRLVAWVNNDLGTLLEWTTDEGWQPWSLI